MSPRMVIAGVLWGRRPAGSVLEASVGRPVPVYEPPADTAPAVPVEPVEPVDGSCGRAECLAGPHEDGCHGVAGMREAVR